MVPAAQHVDVEELVVGEFGTELVVECGVDRGVVVERVGGSDEESVSFVGPAGVVRVSLGERGDLLGIETGMLSEERDMQAPLVLTSAERAGPIDQDLADRETTG